MTSQDDGFIWQAKDRNSRSEKKRTMTRKVPTTLEALALPLVAMGGAGAAGTGAGGVVTVAIALTTAIDCFLCSL